MRILRVFREKKTQKAGTSLTLNSTITYSLITLIQEKITKKSTGFFHADIYLHIIKRVAIRFIDL